MGNFKMSWINHLQRSPKGFTFVELLVVAGIVGIILGALFNVFRIGLKSSDKGTERLVALQKIRKSLLLIKKDVQECAFKIQVHQAVDGSGVSLEIYQPMFDDEGFPLYDEDSESAVSQSVMYRFDRNGGILYRDGKKEVEGIKDLKLSTFELEYGHIKLPALKLELFLATGTKTTAFRTVVMSRYLSYWVRDPNWVGNTTRALVNYGISD